MSERRYRFGPIERRAAIGPLSLGQVVILAIAAAIGLASIYLIGGTPGVVLALAVCAAAAAAIFTPVEGRTAEEWAPVLLRWAPRSLRSGYRSPAPSAGLRGSGVETHPESLPPEMNGLRLLSVPYGSDQVGVIRDRRRGTFTAAISVQGAGAFALRDAAEQERALAAWGGVLASCANANSPLRRLQWIERTLPGQGDDLASYLQEKRDRNVPIESGAVASYIELLEGAAPVTQQHEVLVALQIDQRRAGRELKRLGGGEAGACELLLREAAGLAARLGEAEVAVHGLLRPSQYAEVIRDAFDPFGRQARARAALADPEREGVEPARMGPLADEERWSIYRSDSAVHRTYWVSSLPRTEVGPMFLAPLLMQSAAVRTVGVTIEPVPYARAMRRAEMAQTAEVAEEIARERQGFLTTASIRRRQQASARREDELAAGFAETIFAPFVTVSDTDTPALERSSPQVEHAAHLAHLELQPMYGEQAAGFLNTLPLCRGLRGGRW